MEFTIKQPTDVKKSKTTNGKIIQYINSEGIKKVFDVHQYSKIGTLYFKRKTEIEIAVA